MKLSTFVLALALLTALPCRMLFPQEADTTVYQIRNADCHIDGRTRPYALLLYGEIEKGKRIKGLKNLETWIDERRQLLVNRRALEEDVRIDYVFDAPDEKGVVPVDLSIYVKDSWNLIALPKPKFDSNTGLDLRVNARDYNFLGSLNPLRLDIAYLRDENNQNSFELVVDTDTPFSLLGFDWNLSFDNTIGYTTKDGRTAPQDGIYYVNSTDLSMEMPFKFTTFKFGLNQKTFINEGNSDENRERYHLPAFLSGPYASSRFYTDWEIPTGFFVGPFGELTDTASVNFSVSYRGGEDLDDSRRGAVIKVSDNLHFGRIDWIGNLRKGLQASLAIDNSYNINREKWDFNVKLEVTGHYPFTDFFGFSGRAWYEQITFGSVDKDYSTSAGGGIRGIPDDDIQADYMLALNTNFPIRFMEILPSEWYNRSKLRLIDFEFQFSPFADIALASVPGKGIKGFYGGGGELMIFSRFMRNLYLRVSIGYNLENIFSGKKPNSDALLNGALGDEIFIGLGHHF